MSVSPNKESSKADDFELPLRWRTHRAVEEPIKAIATMLVIIVVGILSAIFMNAIFWGFFAIIVLFFGLLRFFLPTYYAVDSAGIREKFIGVERMASWRNFKRIVVSGRDVLLSPYPKRSFLDRFRGWQVRTPDEKTSEFLKNMVMKYNAENK